MLDKIVNGEKNFYKLAKWREKKTRDICQVQCIRDEDCRVLLEDDELKGRWKNYFDKLLNEKHEENLSEEGLSASSGSGSQDYVFHRRVQKPEWRRR